MTVHYERYPGTPPAEWELKLLEAARRTPILIDDDCPELTEEIYRNSIANSLSPRRFFSQVTSTPTKLGESQAI